ncbi:MAG: phosphate ABC transporter permease PstA [Clostridia bacterium]|nr:phosphate ABC transporter permease PstA [Clostridia bacterium]
MAKSKVKKSSGVSGAKVKEGSFKGLFILCACMTTVAVFGIIGYILYASIPAFRSIGVFNFLFGTLWNSKLEGTYSDSEIYGILPMIANSVLVTLSSMLIGGTIGIFTAVFIVFWCPDKFALKYSGNNKFFSKCVNLINKINLKTVFDQIIKLLSGIPSVIYGYFGYYTFVKFFSNISSTHMGTGLLASMCVLAIMVVPTVCSLTKNALDAVPESYMEGALALGNTKAQAVFNVVIPAARSGIISALILGIGRAIGETMAVSMVCGSRTLFPSGLFTPIATLTTVIASEYNESAVGSTHRSALIAAGFVLLIIVLIINLSLNLVPSGFNSKKDAKKKNKKLISSSETPSEAVFVRKGKLQEVLKYVAMVLAGVMAVILAWIILFILIEGIPNLSWHFLFGSSSLDDITLTPAYLSTLYTVLIALAIALPLGIGAAIYLNEYAKPGSKFVKVIRMFTDTLSGVPSIVFGIFGALCFVTWFGGKTSVLAGACTCALMVLPTMIRSTEESLRSVPMTLREASYGLGAGKVRTIFKVVLPSAFPGIATATVLSIGRIIGESAALILTSGMVVATMSSAVNPMNSGSTLTLLLYKFFSEPTSSYGFEEFAATAVVLLVITLILNTIVYLIERHVKRKR